MAPKLYADEAPVKKSEAKDVGLWLDRISVAKKEQERWADESGAKRFEKEYVGDYGIVFNGRNKKIPIPPIGDVFTYVQSDIATTYNRDPYITVNAESGTPKGAALWEVALNYWWRELKTKEELEYEIIDKDLVGYAFHKVGHSVNSSGSGDTLKVDDEKLYSAWLGWRDVLWNVGAKRPPNDCLWMAQRIVKPLDDVKKKYPSARGLEGVPTPDVDKDTYKKSAYKDDIKVAVLWEIWDAQGKQILLLAEGLTDRFLEAPRPWPDYLDEFPFLMYWDFKGKDRPMSAIAPWEPQILEEMVIMGSAINHAKRWNRQVFYNGGELDENAMDKYERGDDGAMIRVAGKVDGESLRFVDYGQLPTDFYLLMDRLQAIKRNVNGQPEFVQGGVTKTNTRTIGELQLMQQGVRGRQERKQDRLETHCENIARHMMAHLKANFDFDGMVKITGETPDKVLEALGDHFDPVTKTVKFTAQDIEGEYDVNIKSGSTLPLNKQNRTQMLEMILQTVAAAAANGPMTQFQATLIMELLRDFEIKSLKEAYEADLAQAEQAKQEQQGQTDVESQKVLAETAKRNAQAQQIGVDTAIKTQDAQLGPVVRAQVKKSESHAPLPGESISYKDLPEDGKIQMAAQAGIHLTSAPIVVPPKNGAKP